MIRLTTTTQTLEIVLSGAVTTNELPVVVSYSDKTTTSYNGGTQLANTNGTTPVTICAAPAASTIRDIDFITVKNADTVAASISISFDNNGTGYEIASIDLNSGDQAIYVHGSGWQVLDIDGQLKTSGSGGGSGTVTSVAVSGGTTGLTTSGSPITTAGTITFAGTLAAANGGTGLTSPGANGNVLTSDGAVWVSSPPSGSGSDLLIIYNNENLNIATNTQVTGHESLTFTGTGNLVINGTGSLRIL